MKALERGAVKAHDRTLLCQNGGSIDITRDQALSLLKRMNMVKRHGNTTEEHVITNFEELKSRFLKDIKTLVDKHDIPPRINNNF